MKSDFSILVVTNKFAPHAGGTATVWTEWCKRWPCEQVTVLTQVAPGCKEFDSRQRFRIRRVWYPDVPKLRVVWSTLGLALLSLLHVIRERPRIVHFGQLIETAFWAPLLKFCLRTPYYIHTYGEELALCHRVPWLARLAQWVLSNAEGVTTISFHSLQLLRGLMRYRGPVLLVHPGVDTTRFVPGNGADVKERLQLGAGPLLLTVGRLMRRKGHDRVIEAMPRVLEEFPDAVYAIAGVGPESASLKAQVALLGIQHRVRFLGQVNEADLILLYQAADIFVHPHRELANGDVEGFGIVFLEASACGTGVIAGRSGGSVDAVKDGVNGYTVDGTSAADVTRVILKLLRAPGERDRLSSSAREFACGFGWDEVAREVLVWSLGIELEPGAETR